MKILSQKKQMMQSNDGHALVLGVILLLFIMVLFYTVFTYTEYKATADFVRTTAESTLDEYTVEQGRRKMQSIKNGTDYTVTLDSAEYLTKLKKNLGTVDLTGNRQGLCAFEITDVKLTFNHNERINSRVTFTLEMPFYFGKTGITSFKGPVNVYSKYNVIE